jgi:translation elongation factor EF-Tu-like GTPase
VAADFVMDVDAVWHLDGRGGPVVTGTIRSGGCRAGDDLGIRDGRRLVTATVIGVEFHGRATRCGLVLGEVKG